MRLNKGKLFVVSAPSGAGKTTLVTRVVERLRDYYPIERVITYTSKQPRPGEVQGIDYHFVTEAEFLQKIEQNFFVEHSTAYGAYYGFPRDIFNRMDDGYHYIAIVDLAGAASIKARKEDAVLIWITPPDKNVLEERLTARAHDSAEQIAFRLLLAEQEMAELAKEGLFEHVIVNASFEVAREALESIIKRSLR